MLAQDVVKPVRKKRRLYLLRIFRAYGGNRIGTEYCALGQIDVAVKFDGGSIHLIKSEKVTHRFPAIYALIFYIMNGIDGFYTGIACAPSVSALEQDDGKCCLPVICTVDIGKEIHHSHEREYRIRKEGKSLSVIKKAIECIALEIIFVIDKIIFYTAAFKREYTAVLLTPRNGYVSPTFEFHLRTVFLAYF